jgi:hypothetical protein
LFFFFASFLLALWINAKVNKEHFVVYIFNFVHFNANTNNTLTLSYSQKNVSKHFFGVFQFNTIILKTRSNNNNPIIFILICWQYCFCQVWLFKEPVNVCFSDCLCMFFSVFISGIFFCV